MSREHGSLSQPHFLRVVASTMDSIIRRIYYKGRNAQRSLVSRLGKQRMHKGRGVYIRSSRARYADFHGAEAELYATAKATVQTLPDDILLEIFKCHRLASLRSKPGSSTWYKLAQVCRRWRFIVFAYPRTLDPCIVVSTNTNRIEETAGFWPVDLPIAMWYRSQLSAKDEENILNILKNPARICEIDIDMTYYLARKCASLLEESFPALEYLRLGSQGIISGWALVIPDNFLGNSAPRLRVVHLKNTVFPTLPRLLSTSQNLVSLKLENIPAERVFTAQELAVGLSSTPQLKSLKIDINGDVIPCPLMQIGPHIRVVLPSLLELQYIGQYSYLHALASRIDTPIIEQIKAAFVNDGWGCNGHELYGLFARGEELRSSRRHRTRIQFSEESVIFAHHFTCSTTSSPGSFQVRFVGRGWFLDHVILVSQICRGFQFLGVMHQVTLVEIGGSPSRRRRVKEFDSWLNLLRTLSAVERLYVSGTVASNVMFALSESGMILPALRDLHFPDESSWAASAWANTGVPADIKRFAAKRELCGLPISVHYERPTAA